MELVICEGWGLGNVPSMQGCGGESQGWQVSPAGVRGGGGPCHPVQGRGCVSLAEPESAALQGPEVGRVGNSSAGSLVLVPELGNLNPTLRRVTIRPI